MDKETEEVLTNTLNKTYAKGIDNSIEIVKTIWRHEPLQDPKNDPYLKIIIELQKLKEITNDTSNNKP